MKQGSDKYQPPKGQRQDLATTGRNRLPGRFQGPSYPTAGDAVSKENSPGIYSLDGEWAFSWAASHGEAPEAFEKPDFDDSQWDRISVPSNWELHGYGVSQDNSSGCYRRVIELPEEWMGTELQTILRFEGISSAAHVWVNGHEVGYTDGYSPAEFHIDEYLGPGPNLLAVRVYKWSAGTYLKDQRLGGLFRSVCLLAQPRGGIFDIAVRCRMDLSFRDADLEVSVLADSPKSGESSACRMRWYLFEPGQDDILASHEAPFDAAMEKPEARSTLNIHSPRLWSAEDPFLYNLLIELVDEGDEVLDVRILKWGFRQVDIVEEPQGAVLKVNGCPVKLRGFFYQDMHPRYGQAVPADVIESDLIQMKRHNIDAVWCPYPKAQMFYDLADRLGLYVIDESSLEIREPRQVSSQPEGMERMILNHRNHPCIILWSLGPQTGHSINSQKFQGIKAAAKALDPDRPMHHEGCFDASDLSSLMYAEVRRSPWIRRHRSVRLVSGREKRLWLPRFHKYQDKPFFLCGCPHTMGSILGNFQDYMALIEGIPSVAGGFIGEGEEEAHEGIFSAKGIATEVKALYAPVAIRPDKLRQGSVVVVNRQSFFDMENYEVAWSLDRGGKVLTEGLMRRSYIPPGGEGRVQLYRDLGAFPGRGEGFLTFVVRLRTDKTWAPAGYEVARLQIPVPEIDEPTSPTDSIFQHLRVDAVDEGYREDGPQGETPPEDWRFEENAGFLVVAGEGMGARIRLRDGALDFMDFGQGNILAEPLELDLFRASPAYSLQSVKRWSISQRDACLFISFSLKIPGFVKTFQLNYQFKPQGCLEVGLSGLPRQEVVRFGTRMAILARYRRISWYGLGPQECYVNRKAGAVVGRHEMEGEGGNRTDVRWVSFSDGGGGVLFSAVGGSMMDFSVRENGPQGQEIPRRDILRICIDGVIPDASMGIGRRRMKLFRRFCLKYTIRREIFGFSRE